MQVIAAGGVLDSPARVTEPSEPPVRVGLVQHAWDDDPRRLQDALRDGIRRSAEAGARIVFLPELTLSRYPADVPPQGPASEAAEELEGGPTFAFAARAATDFGVYVQASLFERADRGDRRGFNTAIIVGPQGDLVARTRKLHIPASDGYYEDRYFRPGPAESPYPVIDLTDPQVRLGMPTCWDEWFPEVARSYALGGAQVLVYPTAIGSEPRHPDFDSRPQWEHAIVAHAITNGLFVIVPNRYGREGRVTFYGSSFIADPYGRVLVRAPRDAAAALVADLDLAQGREWLKLFPFFGGRRPDTYRLLTEPVRPEHARPAVEDRQG